MSSSRSGRNLTPILLNDFRRQWDDTGADVRAAVEAVGESGWYVLGKEVRQFESSLAAWWPRRYAIGVASGLDALELGLRALGCQPGDRVLTTPVSAFATTLAIVKLGAVPVFVDCDERGLIDLELCIDLLAQRTDIRYMVPVHLYGHSLDLHKLAALKQRLGLQVVEDCAQSIGAGQAGTIGQVAATSFYPTKNLGAMGDGGAVLTDSDSLAEKVRTLRDYGQTKKYEHTAIGYNSRLDELQAALLRRVSLPRLARWTARRRAIAARYQAGLENPALRIITATESCWHLFPIVVEHGCRADLQKYLGAWSIGSGEHYPIALMDQPAMKEVEHEVVGDCARARHITAREVSLPIHPYLDDGEVERVIEACNSWQP